MKEKKLGLFGIITNHKTETEFQKEIFFYSNASILSEDDNSYSALVKSLDTDKNNFKLFNREEYQFGDKIACEW